MKTALLSMFILLVLPGLDLSTAFAAKQSNRPSKDIEKTKGTSSRSVRKSQGSSAPKAKAVSKIKAGKVRKGNISVYIRFSGTSTAADFFDVNTPFAGRTEEVLGRLFQWVDKDTPIARLVSVEMAALIDATPEISRRQADKRWKNVFDYYNLTPGESGMIVRVYTRPKKRIHLDERLFTVARKIIVVGKTLEPVYCPILPGQNAYLKSIKIKEEEGMTETARRVLHGVDETIKVNAVVEWVLPPAEDGSHRVGLNVTTLKDNLGPGMAFYGRIHLGTSKNTMLVPRRAVIKKDGKNYITLEVQTGLANADKTEIVRGAKPGRFFLWKPELKKAGRKN